MKVPQYMAPDKTLMLLRRRKTSTLQMCYMKFSMAGRYTETAHAVVQIANSAPIARPAYWL